MSEIKVIRMSTGEDIICKVVNDTPEVVTIDKAFVIIPTQSAPGQPMKLMMSPYLPFAKDEPILINHDKIVTMAEPKKEILDSYQQNTSQILTPQKPGLITETKVPKL